MIKTFFTSFNIHYIWLPEYAPQTPRIRTPNAQNTPKHALPAGH